MDYCASGLPARLRAGSQGQFAAQPGFAAGRRCCGGLSDLCRFSRGASGRRLPRHRGTQLQRRYPLECGAVSSGADRLDSLGAIGIARCLLVGGRLDRPLCDPDDPFCDQRSPDDASYTLDHFYAKLLKLPATMQTAAGRAEAERRADLMRRYLDDLRQEIAR